MRFYVTHAGQKYQVTGTRIRDKFVTQTILRVTKNYRTYGQPVNDPKVEAAVQADFKQSEDESEWLF